MLSSQTIDIVKSTAHVLNEHGETLTRHFYKRMFTYNPEVAPFFSPANQHEGSQQRALAAAICAYAANIDNLEALSGVVKQIAHKHASLMVKPEHYPIVGEHLLASIREVLGEAATDDIINAWAEAYGFLTNILTDNEQQIYTENLEKTGGWEGFRKFKIDRKELESDNITSFYLTPEDGGALPGFLPGQYITVRIPTQDGPFTMRNYSLSDQPGQDYLRISVKRETNTEANTPIGFVSNYLHDGVNAGNTLEVGPPCGDFFLNTQYDNDKTLVLLAAGVGVTPIFSMLKTALNTMSDRKIIFIHACIDEEVQAFKTAVESLNEKHPNLTVHYRYSNPVDASTLNQSNSSTGFVEASLLEQFIPEHDADYYFCGPKVFMSTIYHYLLEWNIPQAQVHFEFFGPREDMQKKAV